MHRLREAAMTGAKCKATNSCYPDRGWQCFRVMPPCLTIGHLTFHDIAISSDVATVDERPSIHKATDTCMGPTSSIISPANRGTVKP